MRLKGRQARFLIATLALWAGTRVWLLWPDGVRTGADMTNAAALLSLASAAGTSAAPFEAWPGPPPRRWAAPTLLARRIADPSGWDQPDRLGRMLLLALGGAEAATATRVLRKATFASEPEPEPASAPAAPTPAPALLFPPTATHARTIEAQAYLFVRPGSGGGGFAAGGELGGSQLAARLAWRPGGGPLGLSARLYAPLAHRGADAAAGIDWHPVASVPLRLSIERRQRLDAAGRSAWAAYAAGGFYRGGRPGGVEVDGYAQAGVVGVHARDGFVDGALRLGYRLPVQRPLVVGAGIWGAAQPGVARVDIGPRAGLRLPLADHMLTVALDGRFRVAGRAGPVSGAALTLAADF